MKELSKLERLLRGDEATYDGNKVVETRDFRNIDKSSESIVIYTIKSDGGIVDSWVYNDLSKPTWDNVEFTESSKPRTIEGGLRVNDIIVDVEGGERKILGILNTIVFTSSYGSFNETGESMTLTRLIQIGYDLKQPESIKKDIEISKQEIAELKNIDVKTIGNVTIK